MDDQGTWERSAYTVIAQNNVITGAYNGISMSGFHGRKPFVFNNTIDLQAAPANAQMGISLANNSALQATYNAVHSSTTANDQARALYVAQNGTPELGCNTAYTIGRGFEFAGPQTAYWHQNTMQDNRRGIVLGGNIGAQGVYSGGIYAGSYGNRWTGSWPGSGLTSQTLVLNGINSVNSKLYVINNINENPGNNSIIGAGVPYTFPTSINYVSTGTGAACVSSPGSGGGSSSFANRIALEQVARDSVHYGANQCINAWMGQYALYRSLEADSTLAGSSSVLQSFLLSAAATRLGWLAGIEDAVSGGDHAAAAALLLGPPATGTTAGPDNVRIRDLPGANAIVANYTAFYQLYFRWCDSTFSGTDAADLTTLAGKCPLVDGAAVYQARALLRRLSEDIIVYHDNCLEPGGDDQGGGGGGARVYRPAAMQQYTLAPNPNDGHMQLWQAMNDDEPVRIKVYNALGAVIYAAARSFDGNMTTLDLDKAAPGMYSIILQDSRGGSYTLRFVKK